jgi:aldose 1-epimerase
MIELRCDDATCVVSAPDGGRLASLRVGALDLLVGRPDDPALDPEMEPMTWGCFPMAPWAGRVRRGEFRFDGSTYALPRNLPPHAIHGTAFVRPWHVVASDQRSVSMTCALGSPWPLGGVATQHIELATDHVLCQLLVTAEEHSMPAQVGWHPWFTKPLSATPAFASMYRRDAEGVPTGELVSPPPGPWDDCFMGPIGPVELQYDGLVVDVETDCDHWVVYDEPRHATCIEPQSGPPDGFTIAPHILGPGESLSRWMKIGWRESA